MEWAKSAQVVQAAEMVTLFRNKIFVSSQDKCSYKHGNMDLFSSVTETIHSNELHMLLAYYIQALAVGYKNWLEHPQSHFCAQTWFTQSLVQPDLQGEGLHSLSSQHVSLLGCPCREKILPYMQPEPLLSTFSSCLKFCYHSELSRACLHPLDNFPTGTVGLLSDVPPFQAAAASVPHPLPVVQTMLQVRSSECWEEGDNHCLCHLPMLFFEPKLLATCDDWGLAQCPAKPRIFPTRLALASAVLSLFHFRGFSILGAADGPCSVSQSPCSSIFLA